jgi:hypothetical protein
MPRGEAAEAALEWARHAGGQAAARPGGRHRCSLLAGEAGVRCVGALCASAAALHETRAGRVQRAAALRQECREQLAGFNALACAACDAEICQEDEVLYGKAGTLLGCLQLNRHLHAGAVPESTLRGLAQAILESGRRQAAHDPGAARLGAPLWFAWHGAPYLGAAHGLMGILHALLLLPRPLLDSIPGALDDLRASLRLVLALECDAAGRPGPAGFWPTRALPRADKEPLVHWCHGSAGAVFLMAQAHEALGGGGGGGGGEAAAASEWLRAALRAGEAVWERGLLRKGPGACHGVSGNAYALLRVWRATGDARWLRRAAQFAAFMGGGEFRHGARVPDAPHSLFEGWAAACCLYADLLRPEEARFPLFDV